MKMDFQEDGKGLLSMSCPIGSPGAARRGSGREQKRLH